MVSTESVLSGVLTVSLLVFLAKILAGAFSKVGIPSVLGELCAGIVFGPYALGGLINVFGHKVIELSDVVLVFAEVGAVLILFTAGLEMTFTEFRGAGFKSFIVGALGVAVPFLLGYQFTSLLGYSFLAALIVGTALTATSIAITIKVLEELGKSREPESKIMVNAAVVDDVLALAALSVVVSVIEGGRLPHILDVTFKMATIFGLWLALLVVIVFTVPRFMKILPTWKIAGTDEAAATVTCFGASSLATILGLSPIVGSYAAGMAMAGSHSLTAIKSYIEKINMIFSPIFFAVIGASLNLFSISPSVLLFVTGLLLIAIFSKLIGCGLPAGILMRNRVSGWRVGLGMTSRGEVGLLISGIGLTSGAIGQDVYASLVAVVIMTTILSPLLLKSSYRLHQGKA